MYTRLPLAFSLSFSFCEDEIPSFLSQYTAIDFVRQPLSALLIQRIALAEPHVTVIIELIVSRPFAESHVAVVIESLALIVQIVIVHQ